MTDIFTASNGIEIEIGKGGYLTGKGGDNVLHATGGADFGVQALREYFQAERDAELGRWRDPENPDHLVYQSYPYVQGYRRIAVVNERDMSSVHTFSEGAEEGSSDPKALTARRYFAAHPEPKPWHDAEAGTFWRVHPKYTGATGRLAIAHGDDTFTDECGNCWTAKEITDATRLHPAESRDE